MSLKIGSVKMSLLTKDKNEEYLKYLQKIRKNIPAKYNQVELLNELCNDKVDLLFSITTRGDGKTFNFLYALAKLSEKFNFSTIVLVRHLEVRSAMIQQIDDVYRTMKDLNVKNFSYQIAPDYVKCCYGEKVPFIICDLNNANDLKNYSSLLRNANLVLYDEFLAVGGDYAPHEFLKFKTIFETMDRAEVPAMEYTNNRRKAIFLANPVDFSSEFLSVWKMYHYLETQKMNTIKIFKNIAIERRKNTNTQKTKNNRIFTSGTNESVLGKFKINSWAIHEPKSNSRKVTIKTLDKYINIYYEPTPILDVTSYEDSYSYNTDLVDNSEKSIFLKKSYYRDDFYKKYTKDKFYFSNQYSKSYILENYPTLNLMRIYRQNLKTPSFKEQEKQVRESDINLIKKRLLSQYL